MSYVGLLPCDRLDGGDQPIDFVDLAGFAGHHLPRGDVGVVLKLREDNLVARLKKLAAVRLGDEVDSLVVPRT